MKEISEISHPGSDIPVQGSAIRFVYSTHGVHCNSKIGEIDGHTQGHKDPPVPRRLVGDSHIPPGLSPAYTGSSRNVSKVRLAGDFRKVRTGAQADLRFCRLPLQPQVRSDQTDTGQVAEPSRENTETAFPAGLPSLAIHVLDRFTYSHRETSSPRPTAHETHTVASQKQLECTGITRKGDPNSQVPAPPFTMVAKGRQCTYTPTFTPNKTCSANVYRCIKRKVGCSLRQAHCKRSLVPPGKQAAYKLPGTKSSLSSLKRVPRPLLRQDGSCCNRQHLSGVIHKQGRRHEVGPTLCPAMENLDLVYQETSDSESLTHSRLAERGSRPAIQARPDHSNRVVPPSRGFPNNMQQLAWPQIDLFATRFNNKFPLFVSPVPDPLASAVDALNLPLSPARYH